MASTWMNVGCSASAECVVWLMRGDVDALLAATDQVCARPST